MKRSIVFAIVLTGMFLLASGAFAQELERVVYVPDSLGYIYNPNAIFTNPLTNRVYVASNGLMLVFDPITRAKERVFRGTYTKGIYCSNAGKIYLAGDGEMGVVNASNDSFEQRISLDFTSGLLAYSPTSNRLYVGDYEAGVLIYVFDAVQASLIDTVELYDYPYSLAYDSLTNRLIFGEDGRIELLDCATDSIVFSISILDRAIDLELALNLRRLYCATENNEVLVIDADSLNEITRIETPDGLTSIDYHPLLNRLYCQSYDSIAVIDCATNAVRMVIPVQGCNGIFPLSASPKVYATTNFPDYTIKVIDPNDTIVKTLTLTGRPYVSVYTPARNEFYTAFQTDRLALIDCNLDTVIGYMEYPRFLIRGMLYNPAGRKVYLLLPARDTVLIIDHNLELAGAIPVPLNADYPLPILNPLLNRLYIADNGALHIIDCNQDELIGTKNLYGVERVQTALFVSTMNKLYIFPYDCQTGMWRVWVYDCLRDTTRYIRVGDDRISCAAFHPWSNRVYFQSDYDDSIWLIDPVSDTLAGKIWAGRFDRHNEMLANSANGKLYFARNYSPEMLYTIDVLSNTVIDSTDIYDDADTIFWFRPLNKLYLCDRSSIGEIKVFDCNRDSLVAVLHLPCYLAGALAEATGRLYLNGGNRIFVLDLWRDSVIAEPPAIGAARYSAYSPIDKRVFFASRSNWITVYSDPLVGIQEEIGQIPLGLKIVANPVGKVALFECHIPANRQAVLSIYDVSGRSIYQKSLIGTTRTIPVEWHRKDAQGKTVARGVYFAQLTAENGKSSSVKLVLP